MLGLLDRETGHEVWRYARVCGTVGPATRKNMKFAHGIQQFSKTGKGIGSGSHVSQNRPAHHRPAAGSSDRQVTPQ